MHCKACMPLKTGSGGRRPKLPSREPLNLMANERSPVGEDLRNPSRPAFCFTAWPFRCSREAKRARHESKRFLLPGEVHWLAQNPETLRITLFSREASRDAKESQSFSKRCSCRVGCLMAQNLGTSLQTLGKPCRSSVEGMSWADGKDSGTYGGQQTSRNASDSERAAGPLHC